jgi:hypothetical protein
MGLLAEALRGKDRAIIRLRFFASASAPVRVFDAAGLPHYFFGEGLQDAGALRSRQDCAVSELWVR